MLISLENHWWGACRGAARHLPTVLWTKMCSDIIFISLNIQWFLLEYLYESWQSSRLLLVALNIFKLTKLLAIRWSPSHLVILQKRHGSWVFEIRINIDWTGFITLQQKLIVAVKVVALSIDLRHLIIAFWIDAIFRLRAVILLHTWITFWIVLWIKVDSSNFFFFDFTQISVKHIRLIVGSHILHYTNFTFHLRLCLNFAK